jgi:hypothetical protein
MEHRRLVATGFAIPVLSFSAGTFCSKGLMFRAQDKASVTEASPLIDIYLEAAAATFDAVDVYLAYESKSRRTKFNRRCGRAALTTA